MRYFYYKSWFTQLILVLDCFLYPSLPNTAFYILSTLQISVINSNLQCLCDYYQNHFFNNFRKLVITETFF